MSENVGSVSIQLLLDRDPFELEVMQLIVRCLI